MALNLSDADRALLKHDMNQAEPYAYDAPELLGLHTEYDHARMVATMAKRLLEQDDKEKKDAKSQ